MRERDCKGNKSLLQLGRKLSGWRGARGGCTSEETAANGKKRLRQSSQESGTKRERVGGRRGGGVFWIVLMKKVNHEACNKR